MHVTFHGAVREVTGSMHLLGTDTDYIVMDSGMFQGRRREAAEKNRVLPFDPGMLTNMILSHAHIDHSGRIPLLTKNGFSGRVICTRATVDACHYLLRDSAHIQEQDAQYLNYKTMRRTLAQGAAESGQNRRKSDQFVKLLKKHNRIDAELVSRLMTRHRLESVEPLYTTADADQAVSQFDGVPYRHTTPLGTNLSVTFYDAGHILGSAISIVRHAVNGQVLTVGFTGDLGRFEKPILRNPTLQFADEDRRLDLLIMESTYGDRDHEPVSDLKPRMQEILVKTVNRGGCVLIPSFAFGRTQELLYVIHQLYDEGLVPRVPVWVDSPLAADITHVFGEHPEVYDRAAHELFLANGKNPFDFKQVHFTASVEDSMALMREARPHIVISASGMCEAGRILHHLRYKIHDSKNTILVVGFMAQNTLGRRILEQGQAYAKTGRTGNPPMIRFLDKEYPLKAEVVNIGGFSAHGDRNEMLRFLKQSNLEIKKIAVVHGEEAQSLAFAALLHKNGFRAIVPKSGQTLVVA